jgi:predicted dehydrogenase
MSQARADVGIGLVGYNYWGPNLARNFHKQDGCVLRTVCDLDPKQRDIAQRAFPAISSTGDFDDLLNDPSIDAIAVATPVSTHFDLARRAILAGKDVLVEKPMTFSGDDAARLVALAEEHDRILAVDHTFLFTGAVQKMKEMIDAGELGDLIYFDSVRINLGLFQHDVNVVYDLAPHDFAIALFLLGKTPVSVQANGKRYGSDDHESLAYVHVEFDDGAVAHFHVSWISPVKIRHTVVAGSERMIVYDDMEASEKIKVYDKGLVVRDDKEEVNKVLVDYRTGDMLAPKLSHREALDALAEHFVRCVSTRETPVSDGRFGLTVVRLLEGCQRSLEQGGNKVELGATP